jgi:hypothetical protein
MFLSSQPFLQENYFMALNKFTFRYGTGMLLIVCLFALGCNQNVKVTGTVTYSDNGDPVKFGTVVFTGEKEFARGTINDGKYSVGLIKDGEGIPPGTYTVASDSLPVPDYGTVDMHGNSSQTASPDKEIYYTKEPKTVEVKKTMTYNFTVERGAR